MKGVILAGGSGSRLQPLTLVTNKHLLPVYKKPMIFYPLETLVQAGIKEILIVTNGEYIGHFFRLLGVGKKWNINLHYEIQEGNEGTCAALLKAEDFVKDDDVMVILGDNVITGNVKKFVKDFEEERKTYKAKIMIAKVDNPEKYGVVEFEGKRIKRIVEKPRVPFSQYVNTGLWIFQSEVFSLCKKVKKSVRNEYETTDILDYYARRGLLTYEILDCEWTDAGTFEELYNATVLMRKLELEKKVD